MKTRIKTRQMPGDVSKFTKQEMLEKKTAGGDTSKLGRKRAKSFKKMVLSRERAVIKEQTRVSVANQFESNQPGFTISTNAKPGEVYIIEMKYPDPKDVAPSCDAPGCDHGWLHHCITHDGITHPAYSTPCEHCNADGKKPDPSCPIG